MPDDDQKGKYNECSLKPKYKTDIIFQLLVAHVVSIRHVTILEELVVTFELFEESLMLHICSDHFLGKLLVVAEADFVREACSLP